MTDRLAIPALAPIGVFDSGVGGLSVLRHLRDALPHEDFLYVADSAHAPYGALSSDAIRTRTFRIADFLAEQGAKLLVVACNTATAAAVAELRERCVVPVVAMEPGVKPAAERTRSGVVGVLATAGTLESARFFSLVSRHAGAADVITQPCPGLVERIEAGDLRSADTERLLRSYLEPLLARGADVIVLGCTHYPFLRPLVEAIVGADIAVLDTGAAVAREVTRRLQTEGLLRTDERRGGERFWTSADSHAALPVFRALWRSDAAVECWIESAAG